MKTIVNLIELKDYRLTNVSENFLYHGYYYCYSKNSKKIQRINKYISLLFLICKRLLEGFFPKWNINYELES